MCRLLCLAQGSGARAPSINSMNFIHTHATRLLLVGCQEARLADPATDYDFSAGGQQATYLDGLRREALAALAPHVAPANLRVGDAAVVRCRRQGRSSCCEPAAFD